MDRVQTTHAHDTLLAIGPVKLTTHARHAPGHIIQPQVGHTIEIMRGHDIVNAS